MCPCPFLTQEAGAMSPSTNDNDNDPPWLMNDGKHPQMEKGDDKLT